MRPHSRGSIRLAGPDVDTPPLLDPNYYSDNRDLTAMVAGMRLAREISWAKALDTWRSTEAAPGTDADDAGPRDYVRATLASYMHPVGTCRIGDDDMAVVDVDLRVRGIAGLRVTDGSVLPSIVSANTNATVCAIAERAAELMRSP